MLNDFNKLVLITIFPEIKIDGDMCFEETELFTSDLRTIPDFYNDLNWAWKALTRAREKILQDDPEALLTVFKIIEDEQSMTASISDVDCVNRAYVDNSNDYFNTPASVISLLALNAYRIDKSVALSSYRKHSITNEQVTDLMCHLRFSANHDAEEINEYMEHLAFCPTDIAHITMNIDELSQVELNHSNELLDWIILKLNIDYELV